MDLNELKSKSVFYLQKGKEIAVDVAEKSKLEVLILNNKTKLYRAQRQLGALVYSLAKGHEENQPMVDKYVGVIAEIEQEIERLKALLTPEEKASVEEAEQEAAQAVEAEVVETVIVEEFEIPAQEEPVAQEPVVEAPATQDTTNPVY